jgi:hypothetical protein
MRLGYFLKVCDIQVPWYCDFRPDSGRSLYNTSAEKHNSSAKTRSQSGRAGHLCGRNNKRSRAIGDRDRRVFESASGATAHRRQTTRPICAAAYVRLSESQYCCHGALSFYSGILSECPRHAAVDLWSPSHAADVDCTAQYELE